MFSKEHVFTTVMMLEVERQARKPWKLMYRVRVSDPGVSMSE